MANKLVLTTALLLALVAFATATRFTTTVVIDEERDPRESQSQSQQQCQSQVQGRQFKSCQSYLSPQQSRRPYFGEGGGYIEIGHHQGQGQQEQGSEQENLRQCCEELQNVNQQCRCQAIQHVVRQELQQLQQQQQQPGQQGRQGSRWQGQGQQQPSRQQQQQLEQVYQKARDLPKQCQFRQPQQCEISPEQIGSA